VERLSAMAADAIEKLKSLRSTVVHSDLTTGAAGMGSGKRDGSLVRVGGIDFHAHVLNALYWPSFIMTDQLRLPSMLRVCQDSYTSFYMRDKEARRVTWIHSQSTNHVAAHLNGKDFSLVMSTFQAVAMLQFNSATKLSLAHLSKALHVQPSVLARHLQPLVRSRRYPLLLCHGDIAKLPQQLPGYDDAKFSDEVIGIEDGEKRKPEMLSTALRDVGSGELDFAPPPALGDVVASASEVPPPPGNVDAHSYAAFLSNITNGDVPGNEVLTLAEAVELYLEHMALTGQPVIGGGYTSFINAMHEAQAEAASPVSAAVAETQAVDFFAIADDDSAVAVADGSSADPAVLEPGSDGAPPIPETPEFEAESGAHVHPATPTTPPMAPPPSTPGAPGPAVPGGLVVTGVPIIVPAPAGAEIGTLPLVQVAPPAVPGNNSGASPSAFAAPVLATDIAGESAAAAGADPMAPGNSSAEGGDANFNIQNDDSDDDGGHADGLVADGASVAGGNFGIVMPHVHPHLQIADVIESAGPVASNENMMGLTDNAIPRGSMQLREARNQAGCERQTSEYIYEDGMVAVVRRDVADDDGLDERAGAISDAGDDDEDCAVHECNGDGDGNGGDDGNYDDNVVCVAADEGLVLSNAESAQKDAASHVVYELVRRYQSRTVRVTYPASVLRLASREAVKARESVVIDRSSMMDAALVRTMKQRKSLAHAELVGEVLKQVTSSFKPDERSVKDRIEYLIDRDYLERTPENPGVYRYCV
jgi:hypothetical protein